MSFYRKKWIKATRMAHRCWWCGVTIEKGARSSYACGMGEDDFWSGHTHPECQAAIDSIPYDGEGYGLYEHSRGRTDDEHADPEFSPDYCGNLDMKPQ